MPLTTEQLLRRRELSSVRNSPCWIMLIKKLPTEVSPPKLSIFWSTPWPYPEAIAAWNKIRDRIINDVFKGDTSGVEDRVAAMVKEEWDDSPLSEFGYPPFGQNPDLLNARAIRFDNETIRVWPHEFSVLTPERMHYYIVEEKAYQLQPEDTTPGSPMVKLIQDVTLDTDQRFVRDAALVDGCTPDEALLVALGEDIIEPTEFAPLGWYKLVNQAAIEFYCEPREAKEERRTPHEGPPSPSRPPRHSRNRKRHERPAQDDQTTPGGNR